MPLEDRGDAQVVAHPLARATLTELRDESTGHVAFRESLTRLGHVCGTVLVEELFGGRERTVQTPLAETTGVAVDGAGDVVLVTVLRAAAPFVDGLLRVFPEARQGMVSASRDESARRPDGSFPVEVDYVKLPEIGPADTVVIADPMLATGSTLCAVLDRVAAAGTPRRTAVLAAVAAPEGLARVAEAAPDVTCLTVAVDDRLDEHGFIVPGLGDAGDRAFGTD